MPRLVTSGVLAALAGSASLLGSGLAYAQTASAQSGVADDATASDPADVGHLGDIVVTANKRGENVQRVGISVAALSGEQLQALGIRETTDVAHLTPGVTLSGSTGGQQLMFNVRGVSQQDFSDFAEAPNAVYLDEGYIVSTKAQRIPSFDLERVEILKGPQGTLFGRNATGGVAQFITAKPEQEFGGYQQVTYGLYNSVNAQGAITGAVSDGIAVRGSYYYNRFDNVLKNLLPGADDEWNDDTIAGRFQISAQATPDLKIFAEFFGWHQKTSTAPYQSTATVPVFDGFGNLVNTVRASSTETRLGIGPNGQNTCPGCLFGPGISGPTRPVPGGDAFGYIDPDGLGLTESKDVANSTSSRYSLYGGLARIDWRIGGVDIVSVTDAKRSTATQYLDVDGTAANQILFPDKAKTWQVSEELRASGSAGPLDWIGGFYFLHYKVAPVDTGLAFPAVTTGGANVLTGAGFAGLEYATRGSLADTTYSIFGQTDWHLTDTLKLTAGLRGIIERKHFTHRNDIVTWPAQAILVEGFLPATNLNLHSNQKLWSARAALNWQVTPDDLLYVSFNRGVKAGSFNQNLAGFGPIPPDFRYKPEVLLAYEAGAKIAILEDHLRLNAAAFYYDYNDYQAYQFQALQNFVINADAVNKGAELSVTGTPFDGFDLMAGVSYIDTKVKDVPFSRGPNGTETVLVDKETTFTPKWQVNWLARYGWKVSQKGNELSLQVNGRSSSAYWTSLTNYDSTRAKGFTIVNAQIAYQMKAPDLNLSISLDNIFDVAAYDQILFDQSTICGCSLQSRGLPRWLRATVRYDF